MEKSIKILHIDGDYRVVYFLINEGILVKTTISIEKAISMLNNSRFDLILSEPQHMAILDPQGSAQKMNNRQAFAKR